MGYITQKKIATATKALMQKQAFAQLSVTHIMAEAHLRRQSFYDYFEDKYDVLAWIYNDEIQAIVQDNLDYEHWHQVLAHMLGYFEQNRHFYRQVFAIHDQNAPEAVIVKHVQTLIGRIFDDVGNANGPTDDYEVFLQRMLSLALVAELKRWLLEPQPQSVAHEQQQLARFLEANAQGFFALPPKTTD